MTKSQLRIALRDELAVLRIVHNMLKLPANTQSFIAELEQERADCVATVHALLSELHPVVRKVSR
ncbi:MAG TPA: hypothetical protein VM578_07005 [Candidatus Saccharimonadales bacterium]|nr:hypothetical protein [Candidatus Saccharimonadales bacterium]